MFDYSECLIKINVEIKSYRAAMLKNNTFEAFKVSENIKELSAWLEKWTYEQAKNGK